MRRCAGGGLERFAEMMCAYTSQYPHGENMADAAPDQIDPTGLTGFSKRTLRIPVAFN